MPESNFLTESLTLFGEYKNLISESIFGSLMHRRYNRYKIGQKTIRVWIRSTDTDIYVFIAPFDHKNMSERFRISLYLSKQEIVDVIHDNITYSMHAGVCELADDILLIIGHDDRKLHFVGFSMGGSIAWAAALLSSQSALILPSAYSWGSFGICYQMLPTSVGYNVGICLEDNSGLCFDPVPLTGKKMLPSIIITKSEDTPSISAVRSKAHIMNKALSSIEYDFLDICGLSELSTPEESGGVMSGIKADIMKGWYMLHDLEKYVQYVESKLQNVDQET